MLGFVAMVMCLPGDQVLAQDKSELPWYDQGTGQVQPVGVKTRAEVSNEERHSIAPAKPKKKKTNNTNNTANTGTTTTGGTNSAAVGSVMSALVWGLAITAGISLLLTLAIMFWKSRGSQSENAEEYVPTRSMEESIQQLPFQMESTRKGDFRSQAYEKYQQGDVRGAIILLFSHVLVSLDQKGFVRLKKGKTNRQYLRELGPYQTLNRYFGDVMVRFEEAFFGDRELDKASFETCWKDLEEFQSGLETTKINTEVAL